MCIEKHENWKRKGGYEFLNYEAHKKNENSMEKGIASVAYIFLKSLFSLFRKKKLARRSIACTNTKIVSEDFPDLLMFGIEGNNTKVHRAPMCKTIYTKNWKDKYRDCTHNVRLYNKKKPHERFLMINLVILFTYYKSKYFCEYYPSKF